MVPKRDHLYSFIDDIDADVVLLTETWLHKDIPDSEIFPPNMNFTLFRRDGKKRRGGGVLIAVRNTLSSSLIFHDENIELTWICLSSSSHKSVFRICYRAPDSPSHSVVIFASH